MFYLSLSIREITKKLGMNFDEIVHSCLGLKL